VGLTTPIATITLFSYVFFNHQIDGDFGDPRTALMVVSGLGILMVSPIRFAKFPLFSFKSGRANSVLLIGFIISMISLAIWQGFVLMPLVTIYIGWNIIKWLIHPRRNDTFTEIDP
jgi:phosphatidylserine synthase